MRSEGLWESLSTNKKYVLFAYSRLFAFLPYLTIVKSSGSSSTLRPSLSSFSLLRTIIVAFFLSFHSFPFFLLSLVLMVWYIWQLTIRELDLLFITKFLTRKDKCSRFMWYIQLNFSEKQKDKLLRKNLKDKKRQKLHDLIDFRLVKIFGYCQGNEQILLSFRFIALRIHISEVTKRILETIGGFVVESRGEVYLKVSWETAHFCTL